MMVDNVDVITWFISWLSVLNLVNIETILRNNVDFVGKMFSQFSFLLEGDLRTEDYCLLIYFFAFDEIPFIRLFKSCNVLHW